jgi:hypothetical protein
MDILYHGFSGATANFVVWILHFFPVGGVPKFMFLFCPVVVVVCTSFMHITMSFDLLQIPEQCIVYAHERLMHRESCVSPECLGQKIQT